MKVRRMWRRRLIVLLGIGALFAGPVPAQADDPLGGTDVLATVTSAVDEPVGTVTSTADDVVGMADEVVGSVTSTASGTGGAPCRRDERRSADDTSGCHLLFLHRNESERLPRNDLE